MAPNRVLIVTGSLFTGDETDAAVGLRKQWASARASTGPWLDLTLKLGIVRRVSALRLGLKRGLPGAELARELLETDDASGTPELTEVVLATLLHQEGLEFEVNTWSGICADPATAEAQLQRAGCVFASTTLIRDLGELRPLVALVKRPHNRVVLGGALVGMYADGWPGCEGADLLALGWGERLVPSLARWIRSNFVDLSPPAGGTLSTQNGTPTLRGGLPAGRSLDDLPAPDWALAAATHGRALPWVSYESVRGCPFRCAFCNYPFLFDDNRYRIRSAAAIDADWARLEAQGVRWISCLDSLFTTPRSRVEELCERLISRDSRIRWLCYARADDLADGALARLMVRAGCVQVQVGVESGSQGQLDRMNKRCTVKHNLEALEACRAAALTSLVTLIVGYPGETETTLDETTAFLRQARPDLCFIAPFSTKFVAVPVLEPASRERFGLVLQEDGASSFPAWRHDTMDAAEAVARTGALYGLMIEEELALDGASFYRAGHRLRPEHRAPLLRLQREAWRGSGLGGRALDAASAVSLWRARAQVATLPPGRSEGGR